MLLLYKYQLFSVDTSKNDFEEKTVDRTKLDKWAELLLDTGKRNNLINFKDSKTSTVEVLIPSSAELFEKIDGNTNFEVYDPKIVEEEEENSETPALGTAVAEARTDSQDPAETVAEQADPKQEYKNNYSPKLRKQSQLLVYSEGNPINALKKIEKKAKECLEEAGINVAYIAFGFIHWKENENSEIEYRAPVLLAPIELKKESIISPFVITSTGDDIILNPTFAYKVNAEWGIKLPEYNGEEDLASYLNIIRELVAKLHWSVTEECKIGIFSFQKINMYRDLMDNAEVILQNPNVRVLLGEPVDPAEYPVSSDTTPAVTNPLIELSTVVDADSSQIEAIEMAKAGKSFVLQGPPGTGKSQTITNIIAECLSDGKKVLFVSEKLAALNVVYEKLKQAGLEEFCLELHSQKANKKAVIADLCSTLRKPRCSVTSKALDEIRQKADSQAILDSYAKELHEVRPVINKSLYQLYEKYSAVEDCEITEWAIPNITYREESYVNDAYSLLEQYADFVPSIGYNYKRHPWYGFINRDISFQAKNELKQKFSQSITYLENLTPLCDEISIKYTADCQNVTDLATWENFAGFAAESTVVTPSLLNPTTFAKVANLIPSLRKLSVDVAAYQNEFEAEYSEKVYDLAAEAIYKRLINEFTSGLGRLFNSEYKELIAKIKECNLTGHKLSYSEAVEFMKKLRDYQEKFAVYQTVERPLIGNIGSAYVGARSDWDYIENQLDSLKLFISNNKGFGKLAHDSAEQFEAEKPYLAELQNRILTAAKPGFQNFKETTACFDDAVTGIDSASNQVIIEKLKCCLQKFDSLDNWCQFRDLFQRLDRNGITSFIDYEIAANEEPSKYAKKFKKQFYYQWIDSILNSEPALSGFNRIRQDNAIKTFTQKDKEQFEINKSIIRAELSSKRPSIDMIAQGSQVGILLREGEKKKKQKSIRTLLSEAGEAIQRIKPCFMMSPLSVSTFLNNEAVLFDIVVFDEASQIFPQDAIGAIYRANQVIVVGDSQQMPPSNFFSASIENEDYNDEEEDVTDFESILDLCTAAAMKTKRLCWHYRSRYEQLIMFSNKNFYDGDLVTFPSAKADQKGVGIDYYYVKGSFDRKAHRNREEAEFIVDLIYENIEKYPNRSLGVVAFSVAQQDMIDKLLQKRRQERPEKEAFFSSSVKEPFFVKNLETVQGDERDTIIFSVAYGYDSQGKILFNFGPLSRVGGERRLNVAVTRAKSNVQIVSSMHYTDIDLTRAQSEGAKLLREYLDFAENGNIALERAIALGKYEQYDSDFEMEVCNFLRSKGYSVDTQIGCSGFRIDLGLKRPNSSDYVLAIECDGATYHSSKNARDRDRLRQQILENMGWKFYRIWSTDWFRNNRVEKERLIEAVENALKSYAKEPDYMEQVPSRTAKKSFEKEIVQPKSIFSEYKEADIIRLKTTIRPNPTDSFRFRYKYPLFLYEIVKVESPISEEWILKRTIDVFGQEKVTHVIKEKFNDLMAECEDYNIIRKNGYLYNKLNPEVKFRSVGTSGREIKYIAPEELAAGMMQILQNNLSMDKDSLYHILAGFCGVNKVGKSIEGYFDQALNTLTKEIEIEGDMISLKNPG